MKNLEAEKILEFARNLDEVGMALHQHGFTVYADILRKAIREQTKYYLDILGEQSGVKNT